MVTFRSHVILLYSIATFGRVRISVCACSEACLGSQWDVCRVSCLVTLVVGVCRSRSWIAFDLCRAIIHQSSSVFSDIRHLHSDFFPRTNQIVLNSEFNKCFVKSF